MRLFGHGGEGDPLAMQQCSSWACLGKESRRLCTRRVSLGSRKRLQKPLAAESNAFQHPVKTEYLLWVSARKMSPAITAWVMHLLLPSLHHRAVWLFRAEIALHVRLMES